MLSRAGSNCTHRSKPPHDHTSRDEESRRSYDGERGGDAASTKRARSFQCAMSEYPEEAVNMSSGMTLPFMTLRDMAL